MKSALFGSTSSTTQKKYTAVLQQLPREEPLESGRRGNTNDQIAGELVYQGTELKAGSLLGLLQHFLQTQGFQLVEHYSDFPDYVFLDLVLLGFRVLVDPTKLLSVLIFLAKSAE